MLPQSAWADNEASLDDETHTLTINSSAAGNLANGTIVLSHVEDKEGSVLKIVLDGYFNESDLAKIGSSKGFTAVTEVDMADAQFVLTSSGAPDQAYYLLYNTGATLPAGTTGDRAIRGGTLYKSAQNGTWTSVGAPAEGSTVVDNIITSNTIGYAIGTYGKNNPVAKYVQMQITYAWSTGHSIPVPDTAFDLTNNGETYHPRNYVTDANVPLNSYAEGANVYIYYYYKSESTDGGNTWKWVDATKAEYDAGSTKYDNPIDADINNLSHNFAGQNSTLRVKVYYTKQGTRNWINDRDTDPGVSYTDMSPYEYAYRNNHKDGYDNGAWVKLTSWDYYQFQAASGWHWEPTTYSDREGHYINKKYPSGTNMSSTSDGLPNADNQYAVVMGSNSGDDEFYYNGTAWVNPSSVSNTPHYVDMKFTYWSATLEKATTSKYADEDINPDIFQNCNALTEVDFKAGVVKGFTDHKTPNNSQTVNIGQNVTAIASNAFIRCTALKAVTFDAGNGTTDAIEGRDYPLALEIRDGAFQACENLKNVVIPNRVTVIGNDAFKEAGGKTAGTEFKVTFQRRYTDNTKETKIDGYNPAHLLTIGTDAFAYCKNLKEISLPIRMTSMGDGIFQNSGLEKYEIREDIEEALVEKIPSNAFLACNLKEINIPRSVTLIESGAFSNTPTIETIRFQKQLGSTQNPLTIKTGAFAGGNEDNQSLKDVYVDFEPTERLVICEYNAFNFTSMVGQTNESSTKFATLHFPNTDTAWDFYQGDWKRGLAFKQTSLNSFKDGYTGEWGGVDDPSDEKQNCVGKGDGEISTETGKYTKSGFTGENAKYIAPANGWQQFFATSTDIDIIIPRGSFMRTYSSNSPYIIPKFTQDETGNGITVHAGEPMFDIYRITAFSDGYVDGLDKTSASLAQAAKREASATKVELPDRIGRNYIPSVTGLMMVGKINADYVVYFAKPDFTSEVEGTYKDITETTYPYNISKYEETGRTNLLYPSCIDDQRMDGNGSTSLEMTGEPKIIDDGGVSKILLYSSIPYPYHSYDGDLKFRLFGYYATPNQFKRVNNAKVTRDKAYLKLPKEMFHWANEYNSGTSGGSSSGVNDPTAASAAREISLSFLEDEEESGTTGIKQVNTTAQRMDSNVFYTLEGVRLNSRPTQRGIYIHNGRKIVIK